MYLVLAFGIAAAHPSEEETHAAPGRTVDNVVVPVPSEIFASLDQFKNSNWRTVQRPEIAHWRPHGDPAQIALLLGVEIAEGFIAVEARDTKEVDDAGAAILRLTRALGVESAAMRRSRSIIDQAQAENWAGVRQEWDGVFSDAQKGMKELKSDELPQLVSFGGWLRGTEALSALVLQSYSADTAGLLHQPGLLGNFDKQLNTMSRRTQRQPIVAAMREGLQNVRPFIAGTDAPSKEQVEALAKICADLLDRIERAR